MILFKVRIASLDILKEVSKKLGDIYNSIFTETAPFLAELMEGKIKYHKTRLDGKTKIIFFIDPVEVIEEKVHSLVKDLEDMLGESLQGHFV